MHTHENLELENLSISDPDSWLYEREITINPVTPEADFQIKIQLTPSNFDYSHTNADGSDLRFYDVSDNPLNFWVENWNTTGVSTVYVKVSASSTSNIIMMYGNPSANSASNGDATFLFFDDFEGSSINASKWYMSGVTGASVLDGKLILGNRQTLGGNQLTTLNPIYEASYTIEYDLITYSSEGQEDFRINFYCSQTPVYRGSGGGNFYQLLVPWEGGDSRIDWFTNGLLQSPKIVIGGPKYTQYKAIIKVKNNTANSQQIWVNTSSGLIFENIILNKFTVTNNYLSLGDVYSLTNIVQNNLTHFLIRKYSDVEPSVAIGSETVIEDPIAPIITINEPQTAEQFESAPQYDITVEEPNLDEVWYTIDEGVHNYTITEMVGSINSAAWGAAPSGAVAIRFSASDATGNVGTAYVIVLKTSAQQQPPPAILGYNLFLILGVISVISTLIIRRHLKS